MAAVKLVSLTKEYQNGENYIRAVDDVSFAVFCLCLPLDCQLRFWYGENSVSVLTLDESFLTNFHGCRWEHM